MAFGFGSRGSGGQDILQALCSMPSSLSWAMWVRPFDTIGRYLVSYNVGTTTVMLGIVYQGADQRIAVVANLTGTDASIESSTLVPRGNWVHLGVVIHDTQSAASWLSQGNADIYINGVRQPVTEVAASGDIPVGTVDRIRLGGFTGTQYSSCDAAEFVEYDRAVPASLFQRLARGGSPLAIGINPSKYHPLRGRFEQDLAGKVTWLKVGGLWELPPHPIQNRRVQWDAALVGVDTVAPTLQSAVIHPDNNKLVLRFNENVLVGAGGYAGMTLVGV